MYSVFVLVNFSPASSWCSLQHSSHSSTLSLSLSHNTRSSANSMVQGESCSMSSVMVSMININRNGLNAEPWCSPTSILTSSHFSNLRRYCSALFKFPAVLCELPEHTSDFGLAWVMLAPFTSSQDKGPFFDDTLLWSCAYAMGRWFLRS